MTYISEPAELTAADIEQRQQELWIKLESTAGHLYSLNAAEAEHRKELAALKEELRRLKDMLSQSAKGKP